MSHSKERKEKTCLNCYAEIYGQYCHVCGQENTEPKHSAWHLVSHFFYDITHFDGKFFTTVKDLLFKPGFLSKEYMKGRRMSYLNPIRMYVFTSAFFFIVFFSVFNPKKFNLGNAEKQLNDSAKLQKAMNTALENVHTKEDSTAIMGAFGGFKGVHFKFRPDTAREDSSDDDEAFTDRYKTIAQYDSAQKTMPPEKKDGFWKRHLMYKQIDLKERFKDNKEEFIREWVTEFMHQFPKMLFVSLPIFALLLKLLYVRRRQFYYVDHGIFAIHIYIYSFIALLIYFAIQKLHDMTGWGWFGWIYAAITLLSLFYFYKAMRNFYGQGRFKTFLKYMILCFLSFIVVVLLFSLFFLFTALEI